MRFEIARGGSGLTYEIRNIVLIAKKLQEINLSPKPIFFQYMPFREAILYGPRNLMDD